MGNNLRSALAEVVAHIELLEDTGDLEITDHWELFRTGRENYLEFINQLTALSRTWAPIAQG